MEQSNKNAPNTGFTDQWQPDQTKDKKPQVDKVAQAEANDELTSSDLPDASNTSTVQMGSGQREDSN